MIVSDLSVIIIIATFIWSLLVMINLVREST